MNSSNIAPQENVATLVLLTILAGAFSVGLCFILPAVNANFFMM